MDQPRPGVRFQIFPRQFADHILPKIRPRLPLHDVPFRTRLQLCPQRRSLPHRLALAENALRKLLQFLHGPPLALVHGGGIVAKLHDSLQPHRSGLKAERSRHKSLGSPPCPSVFLCNGTHFHGRSARQLPIAVRLAQRPVHGPGLERGKRARRRTFPAIFHRRRLGDLRLTPERNSKRSRRNQRRHARIGKPQPPADDAPVYHIIALPCSKVAVHECRIEAFVECGSVHGDQPAFAVTDHADLRVAREELRRRPFQRIHSGENLLHLEPDERAAGLEALPVNPFPVGRIRKTLQLLAPGPVVPAVHQHGHDHEKSLFRKPACKLQFGRHTGANSGKLLRRLIRVGQCDDRGLCHSLRLQNQTLAIHVFENRPDRLPHGIRTVRRRWRCFAGILLDGDRAGLPRVHRTDHPGEFGSPAADRLIPRRGTRRVLSPKFCSLRINTRRFALEPSVYSRDHLR